MTAAHLENVVHDFDAGAIECRGERRHLLFLRLGQGNVLKIVQVAFGFLVANEAFPMEVHQVRGSGKRLDTKLLGNVDRVPLTAGMIVHQQQDLEVLVGSNVFVDELFDFARESGAHFLNLLPSVGACKGGLAASLLHFFPPLLQVSPRGTVRGRVDRAEKRGMPVAN